VKAAAQLGLLSEFLQSRKILADSWDGASSNFALLSRLAVREEAGPSAAFT
jgi:hypothetical protein